MAKENKLSVQARTVMGSAGSRRLRRSGALPGIIYNDKGETVAIQLNRHGFEMLLRHQRSENILFDIDVDSSSPRKALLKEVQHDPLTGTVRHVDFQEVSMTKKMRVRIPMVLVGDPFGVLQEGGILEHPLRELEVECLPGDLLDLIEVNVTDLKLGHSIRVKDLQISDKFTVLSHADVAVALVSAPKEAEEVKPEAAAVEGAAGEPAVIGKKKEEGEEAAAGAEDKKGGAKKEGAGAEKKAAGAKKEEKKK